LFADLAKRGDCSAVGARDIITLLMGSSSHRGGAQRFAHMVLALTAATLLFSLMASCRRGKRPHVFLVLVDQLRADHVGIYGRGSSLTPNLDRMGREGFYFTNARAAAPWTYPSVCSLHSGLYPRVHGGTRKRSGVGQWWITRLPEDVTMLAERLRSLGYRTAGFVANPYLKPESGFNQGFDHYEHDFVKPWAVHPSSSNDRWWQEGSYADSLNGRIGAFLSHPEPQPVFVYVHYIDVHGPWDYAPFLTGEERRSLSEREQYRRSVSYVDARIGDLFQEVTNRLGSNVLFIVTSDHGRELEPQDSASALKSNKGSLHDFNLRVPLIVAGTAALAHRGRSDTPVSLVDVAPTVVTVANEAQRGFDGASLLPLMAGKSVPSRWLLAENDDEAKDQRSEAVLEARHKFVRVSRPTAAFLEYDLERDPWEMAAPIVQPDARQKEAAAMLQERLRSLKTHADVAGPATMSAETREKLRSLGYTE
jgi:arylsulfatase A-like enzyme